MVVLLLDDDPSWLRALGRLLERRGASVIQLTSPDTLFEHIAVQTPDVMALDFLLGKGETGAAVARVLREQLRDSCPPLLLVSATLQDVSDRDLVLFDAAYSKDTPPADLVRTLLERGGLASTSRSRASLRAAQVGELGREPPAEESWSSEG